MYKIDSKVDKPDTKYLYDEIVKMMKRGIKVGDLQHLYDLCVESQEDYLNTIQNKYKILNPNSSAQVIRYLEDLNDPNIVEACAPNGKWTSNKAALQMVESFGYEVGRDIINYRTAKKYGDSIKGMLDVTDSSGRIHPEVALTKTNRISYKSPAIMNIPKELLWDAVVPSKPGNVLISADIKNQEPNILINMTNVESLKPALKSDKGLYEAIFDQIPIYGRMNLIFDNREKPGLMDNTELKSRGIQPIFYTPKLPPFTNLTVNGETVNLIDIINFVVPIGENPEYPTKINVSTTDGNIYQVPIEFNVDFTKAANKKKRDQGGILEVNGIISGLEVKCEGIIRKEFKRAWNAMTYGASKMGIKQMCQNIDGELLYDFFTKIPELHNYRSNCQRAATNGVQKIKTYFGTILTANEFNTKVLKRVLLDLPIQGTAADILSLLVKHFNNEVKVRGYENELRIYYTRHDELIIEAEKSLVDRLGIDKIIEEISDIVIHQVDDWEPFKVSIQVIKSSHNISEILESDDTEE